MTTKEFWKKHSTKIVGSAAIVAGAIIGYNCGTREIVKRCQGYHYITLLTKNKQFADNVDMFLNASLCKAAYHCAKVSVPRDEVVEFVTKKVSELPKDQKTIDIMMTSVVGK